MSRIVGALALVAFVPAAAVAQTPAADAPTPSTPVTAVPAPKVPQAPMPYRWSGVYFGGILGYGRATAEVTTTATYTPAGYFNLVSVEDIADQGAQTMHPNSSLFGGEAGYDFQVARVVFGGSFDMSWMTINDTVNSGKPYSCCAANTFVISQTVETNWFITARARAGWLMSRRLLVFGTAGIAWTDLKYQAQFSDNLSNATESAETDQWIHTWVYGAGAEWRLGRHVAVKGEYLYANFDPLSVTSTNLSTTAGTTNPFTHTADLNLSVFQGSIKIRF